MKTAITPALLLLILVAVTVTGCSDQLESHYATVAAADRDGAFERGWLPAVLKPDVTDIREWHDLDTNDVRGKFALNESVVHRLQSDCELTRDVPRTIRSTPSWWPDVITRGEVSAKSFNVFRCGDFFVAADTNNRAGYFWDKR